MELELMAHSVIDLILCVFLILFVLIMSSSIHPIFQTPYYIFIYSTGIAGILMVTSGWAYRWLQFIALTGECAWVVYVVEIIYFSSAFIQFNGKILMLVRRYICLRQSIEGRDCTWSMSSVRILIFIQYVLPIGTHLLILLDDIAWSEPDATGSVYFRGLYGYKKMQMYRFVTLYVFAVYAGIIIVLNIFSIRRFQRLISCRVEGVRRDDVISKLGMYRNLVLHGICFSTIALSFVVHQFVVSIAIEGDEVEMIFFMRRVYRIACDLLVFTGPLLLLICSPYVRAEIRRRFGYDKKALGRVYAKYSEIEMYH